MRAQLVDGVRGRQVDLPLHRPPRDLLRPQDGAQVERPRNHGARRARVRRGGAGIEGGGTPGESAHAGRGGKECSQGKGGEVQETIVSLKFASL